MTLEFEFRPAPTSWVFFVDEGSSGTTTTPVPAAPSPGHGDRSVPAAGPSVAGTGSAPAGAAESRAVAPVGPPWREGRPRAWCQRHLIAAVECPRCEGLVEDGGVEVGDLALVGAVWFEVVRGADGRLVLAGLVNGRGDQGGLW